MLIPPKKLALYPLYLATIFHRFSSVATIGRLLSFNNVFLPNHILFVSTMYVHIIISPLSSSLPLTASPQWQPWCRKPLPPQAG